MRNVSLGFNEPRSTDKSDLKIRPMYLHLLERHFSELK